MASDPTSRSLAGNETARSPASRRYGEIRARVGRLEPSNYDISDTCNLRCEGCLFFDGADRHGHDDAADDAAWDRFFAAAGARGVNFAYIAGAEPALVPNRLRSAHRHIANGVIFTNGTRRIPPEIDFRIHVSVWGAPAENARLRGADNVTKAIRHYAGDPRATFIYTIGRTNIADNFETARVMHAAGCTLSFNYFSPTTTYLGKLAAQSGADEYFKISSADQNLVLTRDAFAAARRPAWSTRCWRRAPRATTARPWPCGPVPVPPQKDRRADAVAAPASRVARCPARDTARSGRYRAAEAGVSRRSAAARAAPARAASTPSCCLPAAPDRGRFRASAIAARRYRRRAQPVRRGTI